MGPIFSIFFIGGVAYSITRYRLMDIRFIFRKVVVYFFVSIIFLIFIIGSIYLVAWFIGQRIPDYLLVTTGAVTMTVSLFFFDILKKILERFANKHFFTSIYDYQSTLETLGKELTYSIDLEGIIDSVVETIKNSMGLDRAGVLVLDKKTSNYRVQKVVGFNEQNGIALVRNNYLTNYLTKQKSTLLFQEIEAMQKNDTADKIQLSKLRQNMRRIEAAVCLPLTVKNSLIGIIVLGNKLSRDAYTSEDIRLLESIANQASFAIENARLYQEVQDFNQTLKQQVEKQTKGIKELLEIKSQFLAVASHQLRTPVSIVRGFLSMIDAGDVKGKQKEDFIHKAFLASNAMERVVHELLTITEMETGRMKIQIKACDLMPLVEAITETRQSIAQKKK